MNLFTRNNTNTRAQLNYRVNFWPIGQLGFGAKELIVHNFITHLRKSTICDCLSGDMNTMFYNQQEYEVCWAYNNIPSQAEWEGKSGKYLVRCEFRVSTVLRRPIVVLSFSLPSDLRMEDINQGAFVS